MALNRFPARIITRSDGGNAVKSAAYIDRARYQDERTGKCYDFRDKGGLEWSGIFTPANAPAWMKDAAKLWNAIERREDRSTRPDQAQLAREFMPTFPHQLNAEQRRWMLTDFARELSRQGLVVHVASHEPDPHSDERNYHAHIHATMREVTPEGFGKKIRLSKPQQRAQLLHMKERWSELGARQLEHAGLTIEAERFRVGHLTNEKQADLAHRRGDHEHAAELRTREKQQHIGPNVAAMDRRGIETEKGNAYRDVIERKAERAALTRGLAEIDKQITARRELIASREQVRGTLPPALERTRNPIKIDRSAVRRGPKERTAPGIANIPPRAIGGMFKAAGDFLTHITTPKSPELQERENREAERTTERTSREAENLIDLAELEARRKQRENQRQQHRPKERDERER